MPTSFPRKAGMQREHSIAPCPRGQTRRCLPTLVYCFRVVAVVVLQPDSPSRPTLASLNRGNKLLNVGLLIIKLRLIYRHTPPRYIVLTSC